jgi:hypothetical protein
LKILLGPRPIGTPLNRIFLRRAGLSRNLSPLCALSIRFAHRPNGYNRRLAQAGGPTRLFKNGSILSQSRNIS